MPHDSEDLRWMQYALKLALKGTGYVSPNPRVGCVIVSREGELIGEGYHEKFGEAHAEVNAFQSVENELDLVGATVYVTLEPCSHYGKTPPCSLLLSKSPIERVVIATLDPNPKVSGKGVEELKEAEKEVVIGLCEVEAKQINETFFHYISTKRPFVTVKWAQTLDGYVAADDGSSQWITGKPARKKVHEWRAEYDAVMVGSHTARLDDPSLTVRHVEGRQPYRVVLDGKDNLPKNLSVFTDQFEMKTIRFTSTPIHVNAVDSMLSILSGNEHHYQSYQVGQKDGHINLEEVFIKLGELSIASVLVEAGSSLLSALIANELVDKIHCFIAPKIMGSGKPAIKNLGITSISQSLTLRKPIWEQIGDDQLLTAYLK